MKKVTSYNLIKSFIEGAVITFIIGILIVTTLHFYNKKQIERQAWKPLIKVDKNIPEVITTTLTLFYKSNDGACGLSVLAEVSHEDEKGMDIVDSIIVALDKQLLKTDWKEINYTEFQARRYYDLAIIHDRKGNIKITIRVNGKRYRRIFVDTNMNTIVDDILTKLFGVEV